MRIWKWYHSLQIGVAAMMMLNTSPVTAGRVPQECDIRESSGHYDIWTEDGLQLTLDRSSTLLSSMSLGDKRLSFSPAPLLRFEEVIEQKGAPDLLENSSAKAWNVPQSTFEKGTDWLQVVQADKQKPARIVTLNQTQPTPLILSGWCRYKTESSVSGWMNRAVALNIYGTYSDGKAMPEESAYFGNYDHGPQLNSRVLCPDKPLKQVEIKMSCDDVKSTAWYRGVTLKPAKYQVTSPRDGCRAFDSSVMQQFSIRDSSLSGTVTYQPASDHILINCRFKSGKKLDRAISAYLAIPFDAVGGVWHDDVRAPRKIEAGRIYKRSDRWYGAGRDGYDDRYPLACVENSEGLGLAIATDPGEPRVFRVEYDAGKKELRIRYDIGLSPDAGKWANRGSFTTVLFTYNGHDGFRGAGDKFHRIFSWAFARRVKDDGMWMPFNSPECIPGGAEDFHLKYVEGQCNIGWEQANGMYSLKYIEPWLHHQNDVLDVKLDETKGPKDPQGPLASARKWMSIRGEAIPEDNPLRFAAYRGSYITDNWGEPQGYFFREDGRKENMMIVNPNPDLPAPDGSDFCSGALDWAYMTEANSISKQWHIDGWMLRRSDGIPFANIDPDTKVSGKQSLRLDPVPSKNPVQTYCRGVDQTLYYNGESSGPFELSYGVRGENVPKKGTAISWNVVVYYQDNTTESFPFELKGVTTDWKSFTEVIKPKAKPFAFALGFGKDNMTVDHTTIWLDDVKLTAEGSSENLVQNGGFETAQLLPCQSSGVYLDTMECYQNNLNYRREHWLHASEPLTFDSARKPALQQQFSHIDFGKKAADWAHARGKIVFANCAPITCFASPYLDAMGTEEFWVPDKGKWNPRNDPEFNFVRFMSGPKSWTILQYNEMTPDECERYIKRCMFYGVYPGRVWIWSNPVFSATARPIYRKYMPTLVAMNNAGWQVLTLASSDNPKVWIERFGDGNTVYLTLFNPTSEPQKLKVTLDERMRFSGKSKPVDLLEGRELDVKDKSFEVTLASEDLKVIRLER